MRFYLDKKRILVIFVIALIVLSFASYQRNGAASASSARGFFYSLSQPLQKIFWRAGDSLSGFFGKFSNSERLTRENEELKKKNQELLVEITALKELEEENRMLREALDIGLGEEFKLVLADLTAKDVSGDSVLINKGLKDGLKIGMPVVSEEKVLLGKISEVYEKFSRVALISHQDTFFPVKVQDTEITGAIKGEGNFQVSLEEIPENKEIKDGDIVVTTALGGDFPEGLLIGEVREIEKGDIRQFQKARVVLFFSLEEISSVFVIANF